MNTNSPMSLSEYLAQTDPIKMPDVLLKEGEYTIETILNADTPNELRMILINGISFPYIMKGDRHLYTIDEYGNPARLSCFRIQ